MNGSLPGIPSGVPEGAGGDPLPTECREAKRRQGKETLHRKGGDGGGRWKKETGKGNEKTGERGERKREKKQENVYIICHSILFPASFSQEKFEEKRFEREEKGCESGPEFYGR